MSTEWTAGDLEMGKAYETKTDYPLVTYEGLDHYMGETTLRFKAHGNRYFYVKPGALNTFLKPKVMLAAAPEVPAPAVKVKSLVWSENFEPTKGVSSYNHCLADCSFGIYRIEWKGWKDYPSYGIDFNEEYIGSENYLEDAKAFAQAHYERVTLSAIEPASDAMAIRAQALEEAAQICAEIAEEVNSSLWGGMARHCAEAIRARIQAK